MDRSHRLPFQHLAADNWVNLALAGLLAVLLIYFVLELTAGRLCTQIGVDYCDYWSAGKVATERGYMAVYDLGILDQAQESILPSHVDPAAIRVVPFPYLPLFVPPLQLLALLPPAAGFIIWTLLNLATLWLYLRHFSERLGQRAFPSRHGVLLLVSLPAFYNFLNGQVSVWLTICAGQFMLAMIDRKTQRAGFWLAGFVLKPQLLMLIVPILLLQRSFRVVAGLAIGTLLAIVASTAMVGTEGVLQMLGLWQDYAAGRASNWIEGMMNFRMLGQQLSLLIPPGIAWSIAGVGMLAVLGLSLYRWRQPPDPQPASIAISLLGVLAATLTATWHSHIHMAMVLFAPLLLLFRARVLPAWLLYVWIFLPSLLFVLAVFLPPALVRLNLMSNPGAPLVYLPFASAQLGSTLGLFWWALRITPRTAPDP